MRRLVVRGDRFSYVLRVSHNIVELFIGSNKFTAEYDRNIEGVSEIYFQLMIYILMYNMDNVNITSELPSYNFNNGIVSYSGGADSTALLSVTSDIPVHITRSYQPKYEVQQMRAVNQVNAITISTDFEKVRQLIKGKHGFNIGTGYACMYMPLIESLGINRIGFGVVFDDLAFHYGNIFKFNETFHNTGFYAIRDFLLTYNIELRCQLAGYSEALTLKIASTSNIHYSSCHTGGHSQSCGMCYKCFRKQAILGRHLSLNNPLLHKKIMQFMQKKPLKMAASTIYAIQQARYPHFKRFFDLDMTWLMRVNKSLVEQFGGDVNQDSFEWQTQEDIQAIHRFVDFVNQDSIYRY